MRPHWTIKPGIVRRVNRFRQVDEVGILRRMDESVDLACDVLSGCQEMVECLSGIGRFDVRRCSPPVAAVAAAAPVAVAVAVVVIAGK